MSPTTIDDPQIQNQHGTFFGGGGVKQCTDTKKDHFYSVFFVTISISNLFGN